MFEDHKLIFRLILSLTRWWFYQPRRQVIMPFHWYKYEWHLCTNIQIYFFKSSNIQEKENAVYFLLQHIFMLSNLSWGLIAAQKYLQSSNRSPTTSPQLLLQTVLHLSEHLFLSPMWPWRWKMYHRTVSNLFPTSIFPCIVVLSLHLICMQKEFPRIILSKS